MNALWQIGFAAAGSLAFSLLFGVRGARNIVCTLAGGAVWAAYLLLTKLGASAYLANFCAAMAATLLAEILARALKSPATSFLVPGVIPLIPGGMLYASMEALVRGDGATAGALGMTTAATAGLIALGIYAVSTLFQLIQPLEKLAMRARHRVG